MLMLELTGSVTALGLSCPPNDLVRVDLPVDLRFLGLYIDDLVSCDSSLRFRVPIPTSQLARNLASSLIRRRDGSDIQLREVEVPCTAGKPRNYHARGKPAASSSRPPNTHTMQQHSAATQSIPPSSQQPPPTATTSTHSAVPETSEATGTTSSPRITIAGWRARFVGWLCCMPVQHTNGQH
ncbi:hypothetical protein EV702DRAFT_1282657 [Suillus placidus]|uniref:Uncharacterized protein n=1 Tax=Suillus placidus TaxID=48579 RepID=A0A9P6ZIH6_9AGAM|nr:hypothetical protein EV702DRAFT_1282657 [Suillus placidus]